MPSLFDWEIIQMIATNMNFIIGSIILNQCSGKGWLLSEVIVDLVRIYTYWLVEDADEGVSKNPDTMVEYICNSQSAEKLLRNLIKVYCKMRHRVQYYLINLL